MADDITPDTSPEEIEAYIEATYPEVAAFMGDEAIRWILYAAAVNDWDDTEIAAAVRQTEYWRSHGPESRAFDAFMAENGEDSQAVANLIGRASGIVDDLFRRNGITLDDVTRGELAKQAIRSGDISLQGFVVNPDGLNGLLAFGLGQAAANEGVPAGETAFNADSLMEIARSEYMLPITRRQAEEWAVQMLNGQQSEESIRAELNSRARERYGWLGLGEGQTVRSRTDGLVATIADTLELDPDTVDLLSPRFNGVLEFHDGDTYRTMTLGEAAQWAREQPEWQRTRQGRAQQSGVTRGLIDFFEGRAA